MKNFCRLSLTLLLFATLIVGCESTVVDKNHDAPQIQGKIESGDQIPAEITLTPFVADLKDLSDNVVGTLDITHDANYVYLRHAFSHGWQMKSAKVFVGDHSDVPKVNGGMMDLEEFPLQVSLGSPQMVSTISFHRGGLGNCFDVSIWFHAVQLNFFGQEVAQMDGWANGSSILNGYYISYCPSSNVNVPNEHNDSDNSTL